MTDSQENTSEVSLLPHYVYALMHPKKKGDFLRWERHWEACATSSGYSYKHDRKRSRIAVG